MTILTIYHDTNPEMPIFKESAAHMIKPELDKVGIRFEQWVPKDLLPKNADDQMTLASYRKDIDRITKAEGYGSVDVIRVLPDHPKRDEMRSKFLAEHVHDDDEARFFAEGSGMFYIHVDSKVYMLLCEAGDFICVPKNIRHWFDMGPEPFITAIRWFTRPDGWVAQFTGSHYSDMFPKYERQKKDAA